MVRVSNRPSTTTSRRISKTIDVSALRSQRHRQTQTRTNTNNRLRVNRNVARTIAQRLDGLRLHSGKQGPLRLDRRGNDGFDHFLVERKSRVGRKKTLHLLHLTPERPAECGFIIIFLIRRHVLDEKRREIIATSSRPKGTRDGLQNATQANDRSRRKAELPQDSDS